MQMIKMEEKDCGLLLNKRVRYLLTRIDSIEYIFPGAG